MTSHPEFGATTTATEVARAFSNQIRNKNVVITGVAPNSLGQAMALAIASQNPSKLFLASRTKEKLEQVAQEIYNNSPKAKSAVEIVPMDLSSQRSVEQAAAQIAAKVDTVDVLINNAGVMVLTPQRTAEGIELQFGTNHIGHFLFTHLLLDRLKNAAAKSGVVGATRVVNVTSAGHRLSPIRFHDYNIEGKEVPPEEQPPPGITAVYGKAGEYNGWLAYGQSKTANILFSAYLSQKLKDKGIVSYATHPGSIWTGLSRNLDEEGNKIIAKTGSYWKSLDEGAATMLVAAFDPALNEPPEPPDVYLSDCQFGQAAPFALDLYAAEKLYRLSEELVGRTFDLEGPGSSRSNSMI
ncbi:hypothetical protein VTN77DRAFT_2542 [Rasamsonia byssochlamydoides]|uniref:uncharacterized protein n=1 Tax=Rasamsonia byssochlamydoides TaxID=89139 RepID=UPI0037443AE4